MKKPVLSRERLIHPDPKFLFVLTVLWIALAFGVSGVLNWMDTSTLKTVLVILNSTFFGLFGIYVLYSFVRLMILWYLSEKKNYPTLKSKYRLMKDDLLMRNQVLATFTSFYSFLNLVLNFVTSFMHDRLFYFSIALIYAFVFFMKLYLLCFEDTPKHWRFTVIGILMLFTVASLLTVVTLYGKGQFHFEGRDYLLERLLHVFRPDYDHTERLPSQKDGRRPLHARDVPGRKAREHALFSVRPGHCDALDLLG